MKGKAAILILILVVITTPFITGYLSAPSEIDDFDEAFADIQKFWINLPKRIILFEYPFKNEKSTLNPTPQPEVPQQPTKDVRLNVHLSEGVGEWRRDPSSDIPVYETIIHYEIYNDGTESALDTDIIISLDEKIYQSKKVDIGNNNYHRDQVSFSLNYDSIKTITVTASCEGSYDSDNLRISCNISRSHIGADEMVKLYITPDDPIVKKKIQQIINFKPFLEAEWEALRDWMVEEIEYQSDIVKYGGDHWQLPRETLTLGVGDCEDQAILLASMLRACGYESDGVYVLYGMVPDHETEGLEGHAWVLFKVVDVLGFEKWKALESTAEGFTEKSFDLEYDWENICGRGEEHFRFNDVIYEKR